MAASRLPYIPQAYTNADWIEEPWQFYIGAFSLTDPSLNTPDDFTGCTFSAGLSNSATGARILEMTDGNGFLTVTRPNEVVPSVPKATMATLATFAPMLCGFDLTVARPDGYVEPLITALVALIAGIAT